MWRDLFVTQLLFMCDVTHSYVTLGHIWVSHVTYEWVMSHMNESRHIWMSYVTYEWVTSHMNESRHTWIGLVLQMSHVTYERVTSHMTKRCVTNESRHIWMSHVIHEQVLCYKWVTSHMRLAEHKGGWTALHMAADDDTTLILCDATYYTYIYICMYIYIFMYIYICMYICISI